MPMGVAEDSIAGLLSVLACHRVPNLQWHRGSYRHLMLPKSQSSHVFRIHVTFSVVIGHVLWIIFSK